MSYYGLENKLDSAAFKNVRAGISTYFKQMMTDGAIESQHIPTVKTTNQTDIYLDYFIEKSNQSESQYNVLAALSGMLKFNKSRISSVNLEKSEHSDRMKMNAFIEQVFSLCEEFVVNEDAEAYLKKFEALCNEYDGSILGAMKEHFSKKDYREQPITLAKILAPHYNFIKSAALAQQVTREVVDEFVAQHNTKKDNLYRMARSISPKLFEFFFPIANMKIEVAQDAAAQLKQIAAMPLDEGGFEARMALLRTKISNMNRAQKIIANYGKELQISQDGERQFSPMELAKDMLENGHGKTRLFDSLSQKSKSSYSDPTTDKNKKEDDKSKALLSIVKKYSPKK